MHGVDVSSAARVVAYFRTLQAARPVRVLTVRVNVTMIVGPLFAVVVWLAVANGASTSAARAACEGHSHCAPACDGTWVDWRSKEEREREGERERERHMCGSLFSELARE